MVIDIKLKYLILPIIYTAIGVGVYLILRAIILKSGSKLEEKGKTIHQTKRVATAKTIILNLIKYVIIIIVILAIATVFGINVGSILAGLGITAAILGLALQDFLKDIVGGLSIIFEDQFEVGDTIKVGDFKGEVINIGLKTTKIKSVDDNSIKIISNRNIDNIINYDKVPSKIFVTVSVAYEEDSTKVEKILVDECQNLTNTLEHLRGEVYLLGISDLADSAITYKIGIEAYGKDQLVLSRKVRKALKERLDKENIKIPYPQIEVHNGK
jgi:small-conductance mechanosensitive channel